MDPAMLNANEQQKSPINRKWRIAILLCLLPTVYCLLLSPQLSTQQVLADNPKPPVVTDVVALGDQFALISKRIAPAVVSIDAKKTAHTASSKKTLEDSGSGVVVKLDGRPGYFVLTNNHIVEGALAQDIILQLADGKLVKPSKVWTYPAGDVAVLGLPTTEALAFAPLGDSDQLQQGHWVLAIGSPFGLNQTVTHGIVSALGRGQVSLGTEIHIKDFIQSDAAINPGSSGGPLLNLRGEVIGINTAIASQTGGSNGIAFSIPINYFRRTVDQLLDRGVVSRGYLGIQLAAAMEPSEALRLGLDRGWGAVIEVVQPDGPAAQAGLQVGDIILEVNQQPVRNENHCINMVSALPIGKPVSLVVWRDHRRIVVQATVGDYAAKYPARASK
jgi:S1-C subfamily serine protease